MDYVIIPRCLVVVIIYEKTVGTCTILKSGHTEADT